MIGIPAPLIPNSRAVPHGAYATIDFPSGSADIAQVNPLFYGLWAFATATAHSSVIHAVTTTFSSNAFIKCYSVADPATGETRVVVLHKDPAATHNATITVTPHGARLAGSAVLVRGLPDAGKGLASAWNDHISFGGLSFASTSDGTPAGTPASEKVRASAAGTFAFELPPASFVILTLPSS